MRFKNLLTIQTLFIAFYLFSLNFKPISLFVWTEVVAKNKKKFGHVTYVAHSLKRSLQSKSSYDSTWHYDVNTIKSRAFIISTWLTLMLIKPSVVKIIFIEQLPLVLITLSPAGVEKDFFVIAHYRMQTIRGRRFEVPVDRKKSSLEWKSREKYSIVDFCLLVKARCLVRNE